MIQPNLSRDAKHAWDVTASNRTVVGDEKCTLLFHFDWTAIISPFDAHSTAIRRRYGHNTIWPLHCSLNK